MINFRYTQFLLFAVSVICIWSFTNPKDYTIWLLETFPAFIGFTIIVLTRKTFPLTKLLYTLIAIHCIILFIGGHYTYAEVPLFTKIKDAFDLSRNHYDRLGHFAQGFIPAMIIREILLRKTTIKPGKLLFTIITLTCLGISAIYEILEWLVALTSKEEADAFLGAQGDVWDSHKDILLAGIGALTAQLLLTKAHDKQLKNI